MTDATNNTNAPASIKSKLSVKAMNCQPKKGEFKQGDAPRNLCNIIGTIRKYETVSTSFGESLKFIGAFEATNIATGEVATSTRLFVPKMLEEIFANAVDAREDNDADLSFAVTIGAEYSEKGATGYAFTVTPIVAVTARDPLADLRERTQQAMRALAAPVAPVATPVATPEKATEAAPAKTDKKAK